MAALRGFLHGRALKAAGIKIRCFEQKKMLIFVGKQPNDRQ